MNAKLRRLFSLSERNVGCLNDNKGKFELLECPIDGRNCKKQLSAMNKNFCESNMYFINKEFKVSIEALQSAFYETNELNESYCLKCVEFFRSTITNSLENIHDKLGSMSSGFFKTNRYQSSYIKADEVLKEFRDIT